MCVGGHVIITLQTKVWGMPGLNAFLAATTVNVAVTTSPRVAWDSTTRRVRSITPVGK